MSENCLVFLALPPSSPSLLIQIHNGKSGDLEDVLGPLHHFGPWSSEELKLSEAFL